MTKEKNRKFYKTIIQITILSEDHPVGSGMELSAINNAITDGDCSGACELIQEKQVCAGRMAKLLVEQGSDPGFFGLDEDGKEVEE
jgi:hypothetical protein